MSNKLIAVLVVIILVIVGFFVFKDKSVEPIDEAVTNQVPVPGSEVDEMVVSDQGSVKEFSIDAVPFSFTPAIMEVNLGDTVKITLKNSKGTHDLKIDELNVATKTLNEGEEQTITFVADKVGTFEYYCSVGNHRAQGMVGTLTVQ